MKGFDYERRPMLIDPAIGRNSAERKSIAGLARHRATRPPKQPSQRSATPPYALKPKGMAFASFGTSPNQRSDAVSPSVKVSPS